MTPSGALLSELQGYMAARGVSLTGAADITCLPQEGRQGFPRAVALLRSLDPSVVAGLTDGPTAEYLEEYKHANAELSALAGAAAEFLHGRGYRALAGEPSRTGAGEGEMRTPLPHKSVATLAGLGWIGKCALLVTREFGSAVRLNVVLTDAPLECGEPVERSLCGSCADCMTACPAGAVSGCEWERGMPREVLFDAAACRESSRRLCPEHWSARSICGICIAACPHTRKYLNSSHRRMCK